jgi:hypothetical protein
MADNKTEVIEIKSIEPKEYPDNIDYVVKDQAGRIFHVYKFKKGTQIESTSYQQMVNMDLRSDLAKDIKVVVEIWYAEVPNGKGGTSRYIASFRETSDQPIQTPAQGKSSNLGHSESSQRASGNTGGRNFDQEGYEKCAWNYFVEVCNGDLDQLARAFQDGVVFDAFQVIKADSRRRFSPLREAVARHAPKVVLPEEELPVIQQDDLGEDIPF